MWSLQNLHVDMTESTTHLCELLPGKTHRDEIICLSSPRQGLRWELLSRYSTVAVFWAAGHPGVSTWNQRVSLQEAWVVLRVQLTSLHLGSLCLSKSSFKMHRVLSHAKLLVWCLITSHKVSRLHSLLSSPHSAQTLFLEVSFHFLSPLHTFCASVPSAGLANACTASIVPLSKILSTKSGGMAHVVCSAGKNDVEKPLCLSHFWTYHIYPNWKNAAQLTRKRKQGRKICLECFQTCFKI